MIIGEIDRYKRSQGGKNGTDRSGGERQFAMAMLREYILGWGEDREEMWLYLEHGKKGVLWELVMKILCIDPIEGSTLLKKFLERQDEEKEKGDSRGRDTGGYLF